MTIETIQINGEWLNEVSYNTKTKDMKLTYIKGEAYLYVDVPAKIFQSLKELADSNVAPAELESYLVKSLTINRRGAYVGRGIYIQKQEDKYIRVKLNAEDSEAQTLVAEYAARQGKSFTVGKEFSTTVSKVRYDDKALYITYRSTKEEYPYEDTPSVVKTLFDKFLDNYSKIKNGGEPEREKFSLGKLANFVKGRYNKKNK